MLVFRGVVLLVTGILGGGYTQVIGQRFELKKKTSKQWVIGWGGVALNSSEIATGTYFMVYGLDLH